MLRAPLHKRALHHFDLLGRDGPHELQASTGSCMLHHVPQAACACLIPPVWLLLLSLTQRPTNAEELHACAARQLVPLVSDGHEGMPPPAPNEQTHCEQERVVSEQQTDGSLYCIPLRTALMRGLICGRSVWQSKSR